jgi:hypothetical protein
MLWSYTFVTFLEVKGYTSYKIILLFKHFYIKNAQKNVQKKNYNWKNEEKMTLWANQMREWVFNWSLCWRIVCSLPIIIIEASKQ